ncbi:MAG: DUF3850 domain-containing protein [Clostridia bacterium]|nr:DUF3850 domain-containing protein [Clostridia bacterium]
MIIHHKKIYPEYFQPLIEGKKPFEIRENDENYQTGEKVLLQEYTGSVNFSECPDKYLCLHNKENWDVDGNGNDYFSQPKKCSRTTCDSYTEEQYTGRDCLIKIKEVFDLTNAGLTGYVAFTFDILNIRDKRCKV